MILFDLGAHFGLFSLAAAHHNGKSIAVDPSPGAIRMIKTQARLNRCAHCIRTIRAAASDSTGEIEMLSAGVLSDDYFIVSPSRCRSELTRLDALTVDEITKAFGVPTHIKIDVEGHEAAVLRGARTTLNSSSPVLFVELHNEIVALSGGDPNEVPDELARLGYTIFSVDGQPISKEVISRKAIIRVVARKGSESESAIVL
jgi:FkbM family methyltransferase